MPCYHPIKAFRTPSAGPSGKLGVSFSRSNAFTDKSLDLPCGQCIGCRLERSRQWALRCMHEAHLWDDNCFLTLTYSNENLPPHNSLSMRHFQLFMKKLRKKYPSRTIRFFHCGEYAPLTKRPHYHALLFNFDFPDKQIHAVQRDGHRLYTSKSLDELWSHGFAVIGSVSFESAAYVARYCLKKITGSAAADAYTIVDSSTGEVAHLTPEYATMSRRPGIGTGWYEKFSSDVYPRDYVIRNGIKMRPPKAYDRILERRDARALARIAGKRAQKAAQHADENTPERLRVREEVQKARASTLKRNLE